MRISLALLTIQLATLLPAQVSAAEAPAADTSDRAAMAYSRYIAGQSQTVPWTLETIEIEASVPRLAEQGRMRAIRRLMPLGKPQYRVLEITGDQTVRQQVIFRYLTAEAQAAEVPAASIAITPANYKFSYRGPVKTAGALAYSFVIKPRKKREGLIKGELWLDGETGAVVRQVGYFVKSPSIFVRRITVSREIALRDGLAQDRVTHLSIDTRLVGRAELTIHEYPASDSDGGVAPSGEEQ